MKKKIRKDSKLAAQNPQHISSTSKLDPKDILNYFEERRDDIVQSIKQLVEIESPSDVKQSVDRLGAVLAGRFGDLGGKVEIHKAEKFGNHLQVIFAGQTDSKPLLLLGHMDTVYPIGTISTMPCQVDKERVWGPGTLDMKSGIALILHAIEGLRDWYGSELPRPVTVLLVSDEEVGSDSSRYITEALAKKSSAVLVMEPSFGLKGAVKTARKGVGEYIVKVTGVAAHAGLDFEKGHNAILELVRQIAEISELTDLQRGLTVNVGTIQGGTRGNVVPAEAKATIDVRIAQNEDGAAIHRKIRSITTFNRKCKIEVLGGFNRPPMERTAGVAMLYEKATSIAKELGWKLQEAAVGGGSDGNFTAALGIPTLDGLGGVGEGAHANHESVLISELPRRAALLARLIQTA